jgi:hypothetical protein
VPPLSGKWQTRFHPRPPTIEALTPLRKCEPFSRSAARFSPNVAEDKDDSIQRAVIVEDGSAAVVDRYLSAISGNKHRVVREDGLGLWVSSEIIHRHHGALRFRSSQTERRRGTAFTIFLPFDGVGRE